VKLNDQCLTDRSKNLVFSAEKRQRLLDFTLVGSEKLGSHSAYKRTNVLGPVEFYSLEGATVNQVNRRTIIVMAVVVGLGVANLFYCQPLLAQIGTSLGIGTRSGYIPTFTLGGVMLSMFAVVPLGDMTERRRLIIAVSIASGCASALTAISPNFV
jgi:hypothetical protein